MAEREHRIGASEVAAALSLSSFKTPLRWQLEKLGQVDHEPPNEAQRLGVKLEPGIRLAFEAEHGVKVTHGEALALLFPRHERRATGISVDHPDLQHQAASPDGIIRPEDMTREFAERFGVDVAAGEHVAWEGKSTGIAHRTPPRLLATRWGAPGSDVIPLEYSVQVQSGMLVVDAELRRLGRGFCQKTILSAIVPGIGMPDYVVAALRDVQDWIVDGIKHVVSEHLIGGVPMAATTVEDFKMLEQLVADGRTEPDKHAKKRHQPRPATFDEEILIASFLAAKRAKERAELLEARERLALVEAMGDAYGLTSDVGRAIHTYGSKSKRFNPWSFSNKVKDLATRAVAAGKPIDPAEIIKLVEESKTSTTTGRMLKVTAPKEKDDVGEPAGTGTAARIGEGERIAEP